VSVALAASGCTVVRETSPSRTATEQLLVSTAVDHAVERLALDFPSGSKVFVVASYFEGVDSRYAIGAIRDRLLRLGARLTDERRDSDLIVEIRSGALSVDERRTIIGIPALAIPVPLAGTLQLPEIALFKRYHRQGVAKFAATVYRAGGGTLETSQAPLYGFSNLIDWTLLFVVSWVTTDLVPPHKDPDRETGEPPDPYPAQTYGVWPAS
jgi:hypothetical protein